MSYSIKQKLGAIGFDFPRFEWWLHRDWIRIRNRSETLESGPDKVGVRCRWQWTSDLHLAKVFPSTGGRLLRRALRDWPIGFAKAPPTKSNNLQVSFVIGHRGLDRLPHLLATLRTIAGQQGVTCECIVVEQSVDPEIRSHLPSWIKYLHVKPPTQDMPYCRSWTLNVGARNARGTLLVLHDNDMMIPSRYAAELWRRCAEGYDVIDVKRFLFYLNQAETRRFLEDGILVSRAQSEAVVQNAGAGGSVAVRRDAFLALGGFDEAFAGWGGEDNEFWERAQTRRVWSYGYLPILHLWHASQPRKWDPANPNSRLYRERSKLATEDRIAELSQRRFGHAESLSVGWAGP